MRVLFFSPIKLSNREFELCELVTMSRYQDLNERMAELNVEEEENSAFVFEGDVEEVTNKYELCLVGRFLTERNVNVRAMKSKMADVWKPAMGISIKELEQGIFLFQFYHKEDMNWVLNGGPWSFDGAMLVLSVIPQGEDPVNVPLWHLNMWIQLYDLPTGFMSENVGRQLGDFFGTFMEYDHKNNTSIWRECMRVRIKLDVRKPLKRRKKILRKNGTEVLITCKYERLGDFCFTCGVMTHTERYCRRFLEKGNEEISKDWGSWLRAPSRRTAGPAKSKWLREEVDSRWEERVGRVNVDPKSQEGSNDKGGNHLITRNEVQMSIQQPGIISHPTTMIIKTATNQELGANSNSGYGREDDELIGLHLTDRKRMRGGPESYEVMDTAGGLVTGPGNNKIVTNSDNTLSGTDCVLSFNNDLAKLATQASQQQ